MMTLRTIALPLVLALVFAACGTDPTGTNTPPDLRLDVPSTMDYVIGDGLVTITATAEDPDGSDVTLGVVDAPMRAQFQEFDGWGVFRWDPLASDVTPADEPKNLIFFAEDELGGRTERVVSIIIRAGNGTPRFENSPSVLYNVDSGKPLIFEVRVRDNDSQRVAIAMPTELAPDGADYKPTGDFTGKFEWTPTEQQLQFRVHSVTFTADDGQNETVTQKVSILFKKSSGGGEETRPEVPEDPTNPTGCFFEDRIRHTPLLAQHGSAGYRVEASLIGEAVGVYDRVVLNWTDQDAFNQTDLQMEGTEMTNENGIFVATIPNPILPPGESTQFYYEICAIDDDSSEDDSVLCGPSSIYYSFLAYSPNDTNCADDAFVNTSFDSALDLEGIFGWEHHRACAGASDYYRMDLVGNQDGDLFVTYPFGSDVRVEMFDGSMAPLPFEPSQCSGFGYAYVENPTDQPMTRYFKVTGSDVPYQLSPYYFDPVSSCAATDIEPNDTSASAMTIATDGTPTALQQICGPTDLDVFKFNAVAGQQITATATFSHAGGDIDLKLFAPGIANNVPSGGATVAALSVTDNELIQHTAIEAGTYYLVARGYGQSNTYTLAVDVEAAVSCTDDDQYPDNHSMASPAQLGLETIANLELCASASDWFSFLAFDGEILTVTLRVMTGNIADVRMTSFLNGSAEDTGSRNGDKITIDVFSLDVNQYLLEIEADSPVTYELTLSLSL